MNFSEPKREQQSKTDKEKFLEEEFGADFLLPEIFNAEQGEGEIIVDDEFVKSFQEKK